VRDPLVLLGVVDTPADRYRLAKLLRRAGLADDLPIIRPQDAGHTRFKVGVCLGEAALQTVLDQRDITRYRGRVIELATGFIVPTFHPGELQAHKGQKAGGPRFTGCTVLDLKRAAFIRDRGWTRLPTRYVEDPSPSEFFLFALAYEAALAERPLTTFLSWDIETPYKLKAKDDDDIEDESEEPADTPLNDTLPLKDPILRVSFSYEPGHAVTVPWQGPYIETIRRLLGHPGPKVVWNGLRFDIPVVTAHGFEVRGTIYDAMWLWHLFQSDLPRGLEFVTSFYSDILPWKHEADARPAWYSCVDADAALRNFLGLYQDLQTAGQWEIAKRHVVALDPRLIEIGSHGVHINRDAQQELRAHLEGERDRLLAEAQTLVPDSIRPRKRYKKLSAEAAGIWSFLVDEGKRLQKTPTSVTWDQRRFEPVTVTGLVKVCEKCGNAAPNKGAHQKGKGNPCKGAATLKVALPVTEYDEILDFNPNSVDHLSRYLELHKHPTAVNHKTGEATIDKKHLERLAKRYPKHRLYGLALELRGVRKTLGTYVEGYTPDATGKIYTNLSSAPSTQRLSSRNKNLQNVSHRGTVKYAKEVRRTIVPRPRHVFVEADSSAIEAVMTGYFKGGVHDPYVALAKVGIHDYLTHLELDIPWTGQTDDIAAVRKDGGEVYDLIRSRNKQVVHGTSYGMSPFLMHMTYPEVFPRVADADEAQQRFFAACPGLKEWQHSVRVFARRHTYLENPWKYRHYFYDLRVEDDGSIGGGDAKRCVAFLPQSSAAAFMKDNILLLAESEFWPLPAIGVVHDSYCLEVPDRDDTVEAAVALLERVLTRPIAEMDGLTIGCEIKVGRTNWQDMSKVKLVQAA
jgi:DNA polymerase I-like protein with 3'-5' exonuclease and polymerase domains